jgi:outer membrane protein OmpA-like peptidoglycan-associated protein
MQNLKMKKMAMVVTIAVLAPLLQTGCNSTPRADANIDQLEQKISRLEPMTGQEQYAPVAVQKARESLEKLKNTKGRGEAYQHQLYLTEKQIEIAEEMVAAERAEELIGSAELRRKDILLEARTREAEQAKSLAAGIAVRAQELAQQVEALQTAETDRGLVLTLGSVLFESGKANLRSGAQRTVERVAEFLNEYPDRSILVEGFTDSEGSESYNRDLSKRRAQAVRDLLVRHGVDGSRVETEGYGEQFPVANNATAEGRQQNRRVEIVVGKTDGGEILDRTTMR